MQQDDLNLELERFASLLAHQLKSPVGAADSLVKSLLGDFAGPLSATQKDLLSRVDRRLEEALASAQRIMAIANPAGVAQGDVQPVNICLLIRQAQARASEQGISRGIVVTSQFQTEPVLVRAQEAALTEIIDALLSNALKYTPDNGSINLTVTLDVTAGSVTFTVADSGIGVPEEDREHIFEPFFRARTAADSARPGVGLGLAFVHSVIHSLGGEVRVGKSGDLGGAEFIVVLPLHCPQEGATSATEPHMRVVIIGGVAAGPKVAAKIIRLRPKTEVTVIDRGDVLSYAGCGLPYYVSGVVKEQRELLSSAVGGVRDPVFFQNVKNVRVLNRTEALQIDRSQQRVHIQRVGSETQTWLPYDQLVLATGAAPVIPDIPGLGLGNIFTLHGVHDAEGIRAFLSSMKARDVVIVGGGLLGVEITEALVTRGCRVTILERLPQILNMLDGEMAKLVVNHLEQHGVRVLTGVTVQAFNGNGVLQSVTTDQGEFSAEMAVLAAGVRPQVDLAEAAGLELGSTGAIAVDSTMQTSDPLIYAAGDCCECRHLFTGDSCYVPLGSTANKQGRVAALNICGEKELFPGILGTTVCKVFDYCVGRTGLNEREATTHGMATVCALLPAPDREHFMPNAKPIMLKVVVDRASRRLIGVQAIGEGDAAKRIDVAATAIAAGMTIDHVANLDLAYAPPYSAAIDALSAAANVARNKLAGRFIGIGAEEVQRRVQKDDDLLLLDVRTQGEFGKVRLPGSVLIPLGALRGRLSELPNDLEITTVCTVGLKGYEAALMLNAAGFERVSVLDGGIEMWPFEKIEGTG